MRVIGRALDADGSSMYATAVGDFFLYPSVYGGWFVTWNRTKRQYFPDECARLPDRAAAVEWVEAALSFA